MDHRWGLVERAVHNLRRTSDQIALRAVAERAGVNTERAIEGLYRAVYVLVLVRKTP